MGARYRHTKIIATLGPSTTPRPILTALIGRADILRLNMAHGSREWVKEVAATVREVSQEAERQVAIMMDVKGPEIRSGTVETPVALEVGDRFEFHIESAAPSGDLPAVSVNYAHLPEDLAVGDLVLVDSGLIRMRVMENDGQRLRCEVLTPGELGSKRHLNLPGVTVRLPALTAKDEADILAGIEAGIDFVALSFVRQADDVVTLRRFLKEHGSECRIIAKIEDQAGVRNCEGIIHESDGIMIARGDLGIEIDYHRLPLVQTQLVQACLAEGKPVIVATHLLESMIHSPVPTRAEISDVCNAVREQADAVMLSGETTTGKYPLEALEVMERIIESIEPTVDASLNTQIKLKEPKAKMLRSAATLAQELGQSGIVVFTRSGFLAYVIGALRPRGVPIFAFTDIEPVFRQMCLPWGVEPFLMDFSEDPEQTILDALAYLSRRGWCEADDWLVVITNVLASGQVVDSLQLRRVGGPPEEKV